MFKFTKIVTLVIILISTNLVCSDNSAQNESEKVEENSVKTKRGIHGFGYPIYGHGTPYTYARFPTFYTLSPGKAIVHSFNVNYPKPFIRPAIPPPVLYHPKPILSLPSVPIYGNRYPYSYPTIVHKPIVSIPTAPHFSTSAFAPAIPQHINPIAVHQPTLVSQDGWTPISSSVPNVQHTHYNPPSVTVLPPLNPTHQQQTPNNYYLPPSSSGQQDISFTQPSEQYHQQSQNDLHAHLQHLQQFQGIQHHHNFLRSEQNEGLVTSLSEQGYETASNNGRYAGISSYVPRPSGS